MQRIATFLMFVGDQYGKAEEAMELYVSTFADGRVNEVERRGEDDTDTGIKFASFSIAGRDLVAIDSGAAHQFGFTPAISLLVDFDDRAELDGAHAKLVEGGTELMPLQEYPFSPRFAWVQDRYGVSWQLRLTAG